MCYLPCLDLITEYSASRRAADGPDARGGPVNPGWRCGRHPRGRVNDLRAKTPLTEQVQQVIR